MAAKQIARGEAARAAVREGVELLSRAVKATLGPRGRNVIIEKSFGSPTVTKDGVTVAKEIELKGRFANIGARLVREVAAKTSDTAGDGTTTATVLAEAIFLDGLRHVAAGLEPLALRSGILKAVEAAVADLRQRSIPVKGRADIAHVGRIAANNDPEIGNMIADAMEKVGKDGVITVEEGKGFKMELELVEGMQLDKGYISPYFVTNPERMECVLENALILVHEKKLSSVRDLLPVLERVAQTGRPLLVIAEEVEGEALATLVVNKLRGTLVSCAVKAPAFGERRRAILEDICIVTGAKGVFEDLGVKLEHVDLSYLGSARKVVVDKDTTTIVEGGGAKADIEGRIAQLRREIDETTSDYDREKLQERLAKLAGGVAVLRVGAPTEAAMKERKARVEDALHATRAAVEEGVLPGGGVALLRAAKAVEKLKLPPEEQAGVDIVARALRRPLEQIAINAGFDGSVVAKKVEEGEGNFGFDAEKGEYTDMMAAGIIDPTKVVRCALENAASVATLLLTTETVVAECEKKDKNKS